MPIVRDSNVSTEVGISPGSTCPAASLPRFRGGYASLRESASRADSPPSTRDASADSAPLRTAFPPGTSRTVRREALDAAMARVHTRPSVVPR